jgi:hypothetical protein
MTRPLVYIAGPYTHPDPVANTRAALEVGTQLLDSGHVAPIVPHLSLFWDLQHPHDYRTWLDLDLDVIARCDALLRIPGMSAGAGLEVDHAHGCGIKVFYDVDETIAWAANQ